MRKIFSGIEVFLQTPIGVILITNSVWHAVLWAAKIPFNILVSGILLVIDVSVAFYLLDRLIYFFAQFVLPIQNPKYRQEIYSRVKNFETGSRGPALFIKNGRVIMHEGEANKRGPGVIVLDTASAAVLRTDTEIKGTVGPGVKFTKGNEYIAGSVDLRSQWQFIGPLTTDQPFLNPVPNSPKDYNDIQSRRQQTSGLTRDGFEVSPTISIKFSIKRPKEKLPTEGGVISQYGYDADSIRNAITREVIQHGITQPAVINAPLIAQYNQSDSEVFVSYAWGGESERVVNELERAFAEHGINIVRDKKNLDYKGSIKEFEQRIGQGQCIILVISDKYLRSEHCMHELVEIDKNREFRKRIFPIVLEDARIYEVIERLNYIQHWDERIATLNQAIKQVTVMINLAGITADLDKYARIREKFDKLSNLLSDMNALTPEIHAASGYSTLVRAVKSALTGRLPNHESYNEIAQSISRLPDTKFEQLLQLGASENSQARMEWNKLPAHLVVSIWREYIRKFKLSDLFTSGGVNALQTIEKMINKRVKQISVEALDDTGGKTGEWLDSYEFRQLQSRGLEITDVRIHNVIFDPYIEKQTIEHWSAEWMTIAKKEEKYLKEKEALIETASRDEASKNFARIASKQFSGKTTMPQENPFKTLQLLIQPLKEFIVSESSANSEMEKELRKLDDIWKWLLDNSSNSAARTSQGEDKP